VNLVEQALNDPRNFADQPPSQIVERREDAKHTSYLGLTVNR